MLQILQLIIISFKKHQMCMLLWVLAASFWGLSKFGQWELVD